MYSGHDCHDHGISCSNAFRGRSSRKHRRSTISSRCSPLSGAIEFPQLPNTIEVFPYAGRGSSSGFHHIAPSRWVWVSMIPGATRQPDASMIVSPRAMRFGPTSVMTPSWTRTSAVKVGAPVPSTTVPPVISRSFMVPPVSGSNLPSETPRLILDICRGELL
ncbi:unannotated protein [freshwater metagenome]|uniref:Unannotated protein n=1 Tax=freshwater metagenome TaxID=449393 RepID=A0A6J6XPL5_9ZZZZ